MRALSITFLLTLITGTLTAQDLWETNTDSVAFLFLPDFLRSPAMEGPYQVHCRCYDDQGRTTDLVSQMDSCSTVIELPLQEDKNGDGIIQHPTEVRTSSNMLYAFVRNGDAWNKHVYDLNGERVRTTTIRRKENGRTSEIVHRSDLIIGSGVVTKLMIYYETETVR